MESAMPSRFIAAAAVPQAVIRKLTLLLVASIGVLALNGPALSRPATGDAQAVNRADASRAAQLRHARDVRGAARRPTTAALVSRPGVGKKRPMFGWPALVTEARKYIGTNPTARKKLWCATFLNFVLARTGYAGTGSDAAKSFASYGRRISEPKIGAIAVLTRGKRGGHVGIVTGIDANGNPIIISGNHGHRVGEAAYPRARVIAYVMPTERMPTTQVASAAATVPVRSDADHDGGISSPIEELLAAINAERTNEQRAPVAQAAPHPLPEARPAPYRIAQQVPAAADQEPHVTAYRVSVVAPAVPLPRERMSEPAAPLPRSRPQ
jgi:uncharacterized protein (TIGR02594 family)